MSRSWLNAVAVVVFVSFGAVANMASAHHGGGFGGFGGGGNGGGAIRQAVTSRPIVNASPIKTGNPISGSVSPFKPTLPGGPIVGPVKPIGPTGGPKLPIGPTGPYKPPGGPVVGPVNPLP